MFCGKCGKEVNDEAVVCIHCGCGIIQLFTLGGLGIWVSLDFFQLLSGNFKDIEGNIIKVI